MEIKAIIYFLVLLYKCICAKENSARQHIPVNVPGNENILQPGLAGSENEGFVVGRQPVKKKDLYNPMLHLGKNLQLPKTRDDIISKSENNVKSIQRHDSQGHILKPLLSQSQTYQRSTSRPLFIERSTFEGDTFIPLLPQRHNTYEGHRPSTGQRRQVLDSQHLPYALHKHVQLTPHTPLQYMEKPSHIVVGSRLINMDNVHVHEPVHHVYIGSPMSSHEHNTYRMTPPMQSDYPEYDTDTDGHIHPDHQIQPEYHIHPEYSNHPDYETDDHIHPNHHIHPEFSNHPDYETDDHIHPEHHIHQDYHIPPEFNNHPDSHTYNHNLPNYNIHPDNHVHSDYRPEYHPLHADYYPHAEYHPSPEYHPNPEYHPHQQYHTHPEYDTQPDDSHLGYHQYLEYPHVERRPNNLATPGGFSSFGSFSEFNDKHDHKHNGPFMKYLPRIMDALFETPHQRSFEKRIIPSTMASQDIYSPQNIGYADRSDDENY